MSKVVGVVVALGVAYGAYRYLCYLFACGDAKNIPGGGAYYNRFGHRPRG